MPRVIGTVRAATDIPGEGRVFGILRVLADVVLVGSGTAVAESYKPARPRPAPAPAASSPGPPSPPAR
jgi:hypothetical protein